MNPKVKAKKAASAAPAVRRGRTTTSRLSSKNQITLPVDVIRKAGFEIGDSLKFSFHGGKVIIEKELSAAERMNGAFTHVLSDYDYEKEHLAAWSK